MKRPFARRIAGVLALVALVLAFGPPWIAAVSQQAISNPWAIRSGDATFYDPTVGEGNCSLPLPADRMIAAMNTADYGIADYCGATVRATGPRGSVTVTIIDRCPGCAVGDIDFSPKAFNRIADPNDGRVRISWQLISAEAASGPVRYRYKEGSTQWWAGVQIRNHRNAIVKFEYLTAQGVFQEVARVDYNYFIKSGGMGSGPFTFRITDIYGNVITDSGIPLVDGETTGSKQFPYVAPPGGPTATPRPTDTPAPTTPPTATPRPTSTPVPGVNLALNKPATASSVEGAGYEASKAVDMNAATRWSSAFSDPQWLRVDLGAAYYLNRVVLKWEAAYGKAYRVEVSNDGNLWTAISSTAAGDGGVDDLAVNGSGRYLRVYGTQRGTAWGYSLFEIEAYGAPAATATPPSTTPTPIQPTATSTATPRPTNTPTPTGVPPLPTSTATPRPTNTPQPTSPPPPTATPSQPSGYAAWDGNFHAYAVGNRVSYNGANYECIQAHTSQPGWSPDVVAALWKRLP